MPFISVIILNYNGKQYLDTCLSSVLKTEYPIFEVIFVDNGSIDGSADYVNQKYGCNQRLKTVILDKNFGFAAGNNLGASFANQNAKYLVFLNNDTRVDSKWLKELVKVVERSNDIGVAQSKLLSLENPKIIDCAGGFLDNIGFVCERGHGEKDLGQYDSVDEIFYAKGAAMMVRHDLWRYLGGFESFFFLYFEETDFCWRTRLLGYKIVFVPMSIVYHFSKKTILKYFSSSILYYDSRNRIITLISNYSLSNLFRYLPILFFWYGVISLYVDLLKRRQPILINYRISGVLWCLTRFKKIWKRRMYIQHRIRKISDEKAIEHVLLKMKVFSK